METQQTNLNSVSVDGDAVVDKPQGFWVKSGVQRTASARLRAGFIDPKDLQGQGSAFSSPKLEFCFRMVQETYVRAGKEFLGKDKKFFLCDVQALFESACKLERDLAAPAVIMNPKPEWSLTERDPRVKAFVNRIP